MFFVCILVAAAPASQPTQEQVRGWFDQLADRDAAVRAQAVQNLMGLTRDQLPLLRQAAEDARPLRPSQTVVLRDIVTHIFIAGTEYPPEPDGAPFLGLSWRTSLPEDAGGVPVIERVPGFGAYRMLRDGDVITGIEERPGVKVLNAAIFPELIKTFHADQSITLQVLRDGKTLRIPVQLRPRPAGLNARVNLDAWFQPHQAAADKYWDQNFRPIVGDEVS